MRKATLLMSTLSFGASVLTLAVVYKGVRDVHNEVETLRAKTNSTLDNIRKSFSSFTI